MARGLRKRGAEMRQLSEFRGLGWSSGGKRRRHPLTATILLLVLAVQVGCASSGSREGSALAQLPPLPKDVALHVVVVSGRFAPEFEIVDGSKKGGVRGAVKGAAEGVSESVKLLGLVLSVPGGIFLAPIPIVLIPVGLVGGAIEGASPTRAVKAEERDLAQMVADPKIQDDLRDRVVAVSLTRTPHTFIGLADKGPAVAGERPDYRPLLREGIQAVLELVIEKVTLKIDDPNLWMVMTVRTRLVRTVDNADIYTDSLTYTNTMWVIGLAVFQKERDLAYTEIAEKTIQEMFLRPESN